MTAAAAVLDLSRNGDPRQRLGPWGQEPTSVEIRTAELLREAGVKHVERVSEVYGAVAARYVTAAVEAASHAISGREVTVPDAEGTDIADIVLLAEIHVPLVQLDETAAGDVHRQRRVRIENANLRATHEVLQMVLAGTIRYDEVDTHDGARRFMSGAELGGALHEYASACVYVLAFALAAGPSDASS